MSHPPNKRMATRPYLCIYASQVAMCIGSNRHKKISDAVLLVWQRIAPHSFWDAMKRNNLKTDEDVLRALMEKHGEVRALVDKSLTEAAHSSTEVATCYSSTLAELEQADLGEQDKELVGTVLRKNLYTNYGTAAEPRVLQHIREHMNIPCHTDPTFYKVCLGEVDGVPWHVGGKIDAMSDDGALLIEIKNRVNRLFYRAPAYEAVQVQTYLELLDVSQGALVECLKSETGAMQTNVIPIARDKAFWKHEVVPKLQRFVTFLLRLLKDTGVQDAFLKSKRPSAMVTQCTA